MRLLYSLKAVINDFLEFKTVGHERGADNVSAGRALGGDSESDDHLPFVVCGLGVHEGGEHR